MLWESFPRKEGSRQVPGTGSLVTHQPLHLDFSQPQSFGSNPGECAKLYFSFQLPEFHCLLKSDEKRSYESPFPQTKLKNKTTQSVLTPKLPAAWVLLQPKEGGNSQPGLGAAALEGAPRLCLSRGLGNPVGSLGQQCAGSLNAQRHVCEWVGRGEGA